LREYVQRSGGGGQYSQGAAGGVESGGHDFLEVGKGEQGGDILLVFPLTKPSNRFSLPPSFPPSLRYQTRHGLSTKLLKVFDLELPASFVPYNGDGEVESFQLMPLDKALYSLGRWGGRARVRKGSGCSVFLIYGDISMIGIFTHPHTPSLPSSLPIPPQNTN